MLTNQNLREPSHSLRFKLYLLTSLLHLTAANIIDGGELLAAPGPEVGGFESPRALRSVYTDGVIRALRSDPGMETVRNTGIMRSTAVNLILRKFSQYSKSTPPFWNHQIKTLVCKMKDLLRIL